MRKILLLIFVLCLSACQSNHKVRTPGDAHGNRFDNNPNQVSDLDAYKEHENREIADCFTLCHDKIQELCVDEIVDILSEGVIAEGSMYNEEACEEMCASKWSDNTRECIGKATKCDSLSQTEPYCEEEEDDSIVEYDEKKENTQCSKACYKYKECALMSPDATQADGVAAYTSCHSECQGWSAETITCMSDTETRTAMGCMKLSKCGIAEYGGYLK